MHLKVDNEHSFLRIWMWCTWHQEESIFQSKKLCKCFGDWIEVQHWIQFRLLPKLVRILLPHLSFCQISTAFGTMNMMPSCTRSLSLPETVCSQGKNQDWRYFPMAKTDPGEQAIVKMVMTKTVMTENVLANGRVVKCCDTVRSHNLNRFKLSKAKKSDSWLFGSRILNDQHLWPRMKSML